MMALNKAISCSSVHGSDGVWTVGDLLTLSAVDVARVGNREAAETMDASLEGRRARFLGGIGTSTMIVSRGVGGWSLGSH